MLDYSIQLRGTYGVVMYGVRLCGVRQGNRRVQKGIGLLDEFPNVVPSSVVPRSIAEPCAILRADSRLHRASTTGKNLFEDTKNQFNYPDSSKCKYIHTKAWALMGSKFLECRSVPEPNTMCTTPDAETPAADSSSSSSLETPARRFQ